MDVRTAYVDVAAVPFGEEGDRDSLPATSSRAVTSAPSASR
jgi:hypothetical protein